MELLSIRPELILVLCLAGIGFFLSSNVAGFLNLATGVPILLTPYLVFTLTQRGIALAFSLFLSLAMASGVNWLLLLLLDKLILPKAGGTGCLVTSLGLLYISQETFGLLYSDAPVLVDTIFGRNWPKALGISVIFLFIIIGRVLKYDLKLDAISKNETLSWIYRINVAKIKNISFTAGGAVLGLAGLTQASFSAIVPPVGFKILLLGAVTAIFGAQWRAIGFLAASAILAFIYEIVGSLWGGFWIEGTMVLLILFSSYYKEMLIVIIESRKRMKKWNSGKGLHST